MTDRLTLTRAFEGAGVESSAAERLATAIYDAIHDSVATKSDVARAEAGLRADLARVETGLRAELAIVRSEMQAIEQRLDRRIDNMVTRLGALVVVVAGLLFAALHYWPPHS